MRAVLESAVLRRLAALIITRSSPFPTGAMLVAWPSAQHAQLLSNMHSHRRFFHQFSQLGERTSFRHHMQLSAHSMHASYLTSSRLHAVAPSQGIQSTCCGTSAPFSNSTAASARRRHATQAGAKAKAQKSAAAAEAVDDDIAAAAEADADDDGWLDLEGDGGEIIELDMDDLEIIETHGEFDPDDFEDDEWGKEDAEDAAGGALINTGKVDWGETGLSIANRILDAPEMSQLELFSLFAVPGRRQLMIAIDKPSDKFGSPSSEDLEGFIRAFNTAYQEALGPELADSISVEASSPGAERQVRVPQDLERFRKLPMHICYDGTDDGGKPYSGESVLMLHELDEPTGVTRWKLADVRVNREAAGKGRRLGKKKLEQIHEIPLVDIHHVSLHLDI